MTGPQIPDAMKALAQAEAREIADAELRNDFAHRDGTVARIQAAYRAKREALRLGRAA